MTKVLIVMGSRSDLDIVSKAFDTLDSFGVEYSARILSAHRTPEEAHTLAVTARDNGINVIIAAAGKAAHLAGVLAGSTTLPVIALPMPTGLAGGLDSLLSMVQMPAGIPCATVAIGGAENAALLAVQILALSDSALADKLVEYKESMRQRVLADDAGLVAELGQ